MTNEQTKKKSHMDRMIEQLVRLNEEHDQTKINLHRIEGAQQVIRFQIARAEEDARQERAAAEAAQALEEMRDGDEPDDQDEQVAIAQRLEQMHRNRTHEFQQQAKRLREQLADGSGGTNHK